MSISSGINRSSGNNNRIVFTGMSSGLDTDAIIDASLYTEKLKIQNLKKKYTIESWKREQYRDISSSLKKFQSSYMDILNKSSYMMSTSSYKTFKSSVLTSTGETSTLVSATGTSSANGGSSSISIVQKAKAAKVSTGAIKGNITSNSIDNLNNLAADMEFSITVDDGTKRTMTLKKDDYNNALAKDKEILDNAKKVDKLRANGASYNANGELINVDGDYIDIDGNIQTSAQVLKSDIEKDADNVANLMQKTIDDEMGAGKVKVSLTSDNKIVFDVENGGTQLTISKASIFGISDNATNFITSSSTLDKIMGSVKSEFAWEKSTETVGTTKNTYYSINVNGKDFKFSSSTTLKEAMNEINASDAGVKMTYNELSGSIDFVSKATGQDSEVTVKYGSTVLGEGGVGTKESGQDAVAYIDGNLITRANNNFTVNGITYNIKREPTDEELGALKSDGAYSDVWNSDGSVNIAKLAEKASTLNKNMKLETNEIEVTLDTDAIYENIKKFVESYNELIEEINGKLDEEYDSDYQPLTDEEKEVLSESEIEKLEEKAKTGLLRRDSILSKIVEDMRTALYESIDGVSGGIYSIGITTSSDYEKKGKLEIDEDKLKEAIEADPDKVAAIFAKSSDISYSRTMGASERKQRYKEEGIVQRLYDIIQDNISTSLDNAGNPGSLVAKAGMADTRFSSSGFDIYERMKSYNEQINDLWDIYDKKEAALQKKYANLETLMSEMNSQTNSLTSMLGQ